MGGCTQSFLPVPLKQASGCSLIFLTLCVTPQKAFFWTTRRNNLFKVFWENDANGSCLVPSTTSLPKICAAFLLSALSLSMLGLLFSKTHFKHRFFF